MTGAQFDHGFEFVCCECGGHVVSSVKPCEFKLCCTCIMMPGWHTDPRLRELLGPNLRPLEGPTL
jgi:hypothetical protein